MRKTLLITLLLWTGFEMNGQKIHVNIFTGIANFKGDLHYNPKRGKQFSLKQPKFAAGVGAEYELSNKFSLRMTTTIGKITGDDKKLFEQQQRNLNFTSNIFDVMLGLQYYFTDPTAHFINPYIFAGVGYFHFNPYTFDSSGKKVFLKPLSTEGEGFVDGQKPYSLSQISIPFGAGIKLSLSENIRVGIEVSIRKTFTDYLDDVSKNYVDKKLLLDNRGQQAVDLAFRGDELKTGLQYPAAGSLRGTGLGDDWYYFTGFTLSFRLARSKEVTAHGGGDRVVARRVKCPRAL
jgi:hypothetical protein